MGHVWHQRTIVSSMLTAFLGTVACLGFACQQRQTNAFETARVIAAESVKIVVAYSPEYLATCLTAQ